MPKRISIIEYLPLGDIERRYREADDPVEMMHWHIILLFVIGKTTDEVAEITRLSPTWIRKIVRRYNQDGPDSLGDGRHNNAGASSSLTDAEREELRTALQGPAPVGKRWTGKQVVDWIEESFGIKVTIQTACEYIRQENNKHRSTRKRLRGVETKKTTD